LYGLLIEGEDTEVLLSGALSEDTEVLLSGALSEDTEVLLSGALSEDTEVLLSGALSEYVEFISFKLLVQSEFIPISALVIMLVIQSVVWAINELSGTKLIWPYEGVSFEPYIVENDINKNTIKMGLILFAMCTKK
jgi:hypothetical protein